MTFRFLGSESLVGDSIRLNRFGQSVELTELQAANAILGGCALVDDETFCQIGFARRMWKGLLPPDRTGGRRRNSSSRSDPLSLRRMRCASGWSGRDIGG